MTKKFLICLFLIGASCLTLAGAALGALPVYYGSPSAPSVLRQSQFSDIAKHWAKDSILKMAGRGIIRGTGNNKFQPESSLTKEQAVILLLKALGQGERAEQMAAAIAAQNGTPAANLDAYLIQGYLVTAVEAGLMTDQERAKVEADRTSPAQRQEVAYWTAKALGLTPVYGAEQKMVFSYKDSNGFEPSYLPWIEAMLREKLMSGTAANVFSPKGAMKRAEMAALLERIYPRLAAQRGLSPEEGVVVKKSSRALNGVNQTVFEIRTDSGKVFELVTGNAPTFTREVVVYKNGQVGSSSLLAAGDRVSFALEPDQSLSFIQAGASSGQARSGVLVTMDTAAYSLTMADYGGREWTYPVSKTATVIVNGRPARLDDLISGLEVTLALNGQTVQSITGSVGSELAGYTPPQSVLRTGRVKGLEDDYLLLLNDSGGQEQYKLTASTSVSKNGSWQSRAAIRVGDRVKLTVANSWTNEVSKVEISDQAGKVVRVIKGRIERVYPEAPGIALSGVQEFFYGQWYAAQGFDFVDLAPDIELYARGAGISLQDLAASYQGQDVYLAFTSSYGKNEGVKLLVKEGAASTYSDYIDAIDWGGSRVDLENSLASVQLQPGTIAVKAGKLVDTEDLAPADQIFLEANRNGELYNAAVADVAAFYPSNFTLYRGFIDSVAEDEVTLDRAEVFSDNQWDDISGDEELAFDDDTVIIDLEQGNRIIKAAKFAESRWSDYYDSDYYIYAVCQDGQALAMNLWYDYDDDTVVKTSAGRVTEVSGSTVELERVTDWSAAQRRWKPNNFALSLDLEQAIIYKGNRLGSLDDLQAGDSIYVTHDQDYGYIVFIQ